MQYIRCPGCGRWAHQANFDRAADPGHELELGSPQGVGKGREGRPWKREPMPGPLRAKLAGIFRKVVDKLVE